MNTAPIPHSTVNTPAQNCRPSSVVTTPITITITTIQRITKIRVPRGMLSRKAMISSLNTRLWIKALRLIMTIIGIHPSGLGFIIAGNRHRRGFPQNVNLRNADYHEGIFYRAPYQSLAGIVMKPWRVDSPGLDKCSP